MPTRWVPHAAIASLAVLFACSAAGAEEPGDVVVHVSSAQTHLPLAGARVLVVGATAGKIISMRTDETGVARLTSLSPGFYRVEIGSNDFDTVRDRIEARAGRTNDVFVELRPLQLIGSVRARPIRSAYVDKVSERSAVRKFSPSLIEALSNLGGVRITQVNGIGALIALHGEDPSSTRYEISGVPLAGSGAGLAVNTDLLAEASVDQANDVISFQYLNPTAQPRYVAQESDGGFGSGLTRLTAQGSIGAVGFAAARADRRQDSLLNNQTYRDLSGYDYRHSGELFTKGNYLKVSAPLGRWVSTVQGDFSTSVTSPIPTYFAGDLPAGYGPGEHAFSQTSNVVASANGPLGSRGAGGSVSASFWRSRYLDDASSRVIATLPFPLTSDDRSSGSTVTLAAVAATPFFSQRIAITRRVTDQDAGFRVGSGPLLATRFSSAGYDLSLNLDHTGKHDSLYAVAIEGTSAQGRGYGLSLRPSLRLKASPNDDVSISASYGSRAVVPDQGPRVLVDPSAANFDCSGRLIALQGPGDTSAEPHSVGANGGWVHRGRKSQVSIFGYATSISNAMLTNAMVPLSLEPAGYASPGFLDTVRGGYEKFGGCQGPVPASDRILFVQNVAGLSALYSGAIIDVSRTLSWTTVEVRYSYTGARVTAADRRLTGPLSPYVVGSQIPNVPLHTAGITLDSRLDKRGTEALLHYQWTSSNNQRNLPGYGEYSFGLVRPVGAGTELSIVATNLSSTYPGAFVSPRDAVSLPTLSGLPFPTLTAPLRPPTVFVQVTFKHQVATDGP